MTIEELKWTGAREFRAVPTGDFKLSRNGKRVAVTKGVEFVRTKSGTMEIDEWEKRMLQAVEAEGQKDLLYKIIDHVSKLAWLKKDEDVLMYALECLSTEAYRHWNGFCSFAERKRNR